MDGAATGSRVEAEADATTATEVHGSALTLRLLTVIGSVAGDVPLPGRADRQRHHATPPPCPRWMDHWAAHRAVAPPPPPAGNVAADRTHTHTFEAVPQTVQAAEVGGSRAATLAAHPLTAGGGGEGGVPA